MAVVVDTATSTQGDGILAALRGSARFSADRSVVHPPKAVGRWWRTSWYSSLLFAGVGTQLFDGVTAGRAVVADVWEDAGAEWTCWQIDSGSSTPIYRKYLSEPSGPRIDTAADIAGPVAATAMASLWDCDPSRAVAVEDRFDEMSAGLGTVAAPFLPWLEALSLSWPGGGGVLGPAATARDRPEIARPDLTREQSTQVREWARHNGFQVSARGRLTDEVLEAYRRTHTL